MDDQIAVVPFDDPDFEKSRGPTHPHDHHEAVIARPYPQRIPIGMKDVVFSKTVLERCLIDSYLRIL